MKTATKLICALAAMLSLAPTGRSQSAPVEYKWSDLARDGKLRNGIVVTVDGREALKIENTNDSPSQMSLMTIENPRITTQVYQLTGEIRYDAVQGDGYLELWNYFPPLKPGLPPLQYFSRTMAEFGPRGKIKGTADWREFMLPFNLAGAFGPPTRLELKLVLAGRGTVYLGLVQLNQLSNATATAMGFQSDPWWSYRTAAWLRCGGGGFLGCMFALISVLAGTGKARRFVIVMLSLLTLLGVIALGAGVVAIFQHQSYGIWYPLVLFGLVLVTVSPSSLWLLVWRSAKIRQAMELRRMQALDVSGV